MSSSIQVPLLGSLNKQTVQIFAAGLIVGLSTLYLPSLLSPSTSSLRSLLFLLYPLATNSLAIGLWWATRHQPSLSPLSSLKADSPFRYSYLVLLSTLCFCQLLFSSRIVETVWAPVLVYLGQLMAHFPLIVHCTLSITNRLKVMRRRQPYAFYGLVLLSLLVCVGCGFPYVGSEYALSRRNAGMAWYVLRMVVEVCYSLMMLSSIIDEKVEQPPVSSSTTWSRLSISSKWALAHVGRIVLWALLAYVCRLYANGHRKLL